MWITNDSTNGKYNAVEALEGVQNPDTLGNLIDLNGVVGMSYGFTGEQTDTIGQVYLRIRYYYPNIGVFSSLDPLESVQNRAFSLNGG